MARHSTRLRGRRNTQSFRYIVPAVLVVVLVIAMIYGRLDKGKDPNDITDTASETNMPEMELPQTLVTEQNQVVKETEPEPEPLPQRLPEPIPEPIPETIPEPEPKLTVTGIKQQSQDITIVPDVSPNPEAAALIAEATTLLGEEPGRIIEAREKLIEAFRMPMSRQQRTFVKDQLSKLADKWLFSKTIYPDDKLCGSYKVKPGDLLSTIARKYKVPWEILLKVNKIAKPELLQAGEIIKVVNGPFHARVDRSSFTLDLYLQDRTFVRSFRVGMGKAGNDTPTGLWRVKSNGKLIKPPWPDPDTGKMYYPEDPDYPLGSRWIGLDGLEGNAKGRTGFGIHGTKDPDQIGKADSRGCIRMYNGDVILVYDVFEPGVSTVRVVE